MKAICTFGLFREKVPLGEVSALAVEEQSSGVMTLVTYVGMCFFTTRYWCFRKYSVGFSHWKAGDSW